MVDSWEFTHANGIGRIDRLTSVRHCDTIQVPTGDHHNVVSYATIPTSTGAAFAGPICFSPNSGIDI